MVFRRTSRTFSSDLQLLKQQARLHNADPAKLDIYPSRRPTEKTVSTYFNSFAISDRQRFTLKCYGQPFNYQGIITKRYSAATLEKLMFISSSTRKHWMREGILPEPFIQIVGGRTPAKNYWFYHQVQPVYVWWHHMRARRKKIGKVNLKELRKLELLKNAQERQWYKRLELEYVNPYTKVAGRYGVLWEKGVRKSVE